MIINDFYNTKEIQCHRCINKIQVCKYNMKDYAYKYEGKIFCCYNCYNKYLNEKEMIYRKTNNIMLDGFTNIDFKFSLKINEIERIVIEDLKKHPAILLAYSMIKLKIGGNNMLLNETGGKYTSGDLAYEMGVARQTALTYIKYLESLGVLVRIYCSKSPVHIFNPYVGLAEEKISQKTIDLFKTTQFAKYEINKKFITDNTFKIGE